MPLAVLSPSNLKIFPLIVFNVCLNMTIEQYLRFKIVYDLFVFFLLLSFQRFVWVPHLITGILSGLILPVKKRKRNHSVLRLKRRIFVSSS